MRWLLISCVLLFAFFTNCQKEVEIQINGNKTPKYDDVPTIHVENYINRLFIDLLGREPTDTERDSLTKKLKDSQLSTLCRDSIVYDLQWDTTYRVGDSSYRHAYIQRVYNLLKFNYVEGASDPEIGQKLGNLRFAINVSRLNGDSVRVKQYLAEAHKYENILRWKYNYRKANSTYPALCGYLMYNGVYDVINMGSFNFVNAAFDDVLGRNPTKQEFDAAYAVVDKNEPTLVFNKVASNKLEFISILTQSDAFYEAQVRWWYFQYLRKEIPSDQLFVWTKEYHNNKKVEWFQRQILITDEYAQF